MIAFPLGSTSTTDTLHGAFAISAYAALVATPVLAAGPLLDRGHRGLALLSAALGLIAGLCLAGAVLGAAPGLLQRTGLTLVHAWIVGSAAWMLRHNP